MRWGFLLREEDPAMVDVTGSSDQMLCGSVGRGPYIRLRADHPSHYRAARLLRSLGGRPCSGAEGLVFEFLTIPARDEALHLVRCEMGWSVASPFDGRPSLPGAPLDRWATGSSVEATGRDRPARRAGLTFDSRGTEQDEPGHDRRSRRRNDRAPGRIIP
jgi:hypothetical protein